MSSAYVDQEYGGVVNVYDGQAFYHAMLDYDRVVAAFRASLAV